jgi:DNA gyrase subunit B
MQELVEGGYVYIAVPPLYRVKIGGREQYVEKESQFEDLLVRERVKDIEVTARDGQKQALTEARYSRFAKALNEFEGWAARLRADFGSAPANFVIEHRLVEVDESGVGDLEQILKAVGENGHELSVVEQTPEGTRIKVIERETSAASHVTVPAELLASPVYANLRKTYARLVEIAGKPPFTLALGKREHHAETFEGLRHEALELAKEGIQVSRFKGLGEMNPEELWTTTMDPANRMLVRVEVEDAAAADRLFSMLMGDQVEPRREFIESNAKDVRFLDV